MKNNPADMLKDSMWAFLMTGGQKANIPALKEYVYDLIQLATQKDAGQREKKGNLSFDDLYIIMFSIICEATALVLSGKLDELKEDESDGDES